MFNFYQINKNNKIQTYNHLLIKSLIIPYKKTNLTKKLKILWRGQLSQAGS